jgi:predicted NAD/FAD-dependent oxidoreductase
MSLPSMKNSHSQDARRVAIIGAGITGLTCARTLRDHNVNVVVFDKGRAPGGRLSSPRSPDLSADLGAQYFTARDSRFIRHVLSWMQEGLVARWDGRIFAMTAEGQELHETPSRERFVGVPKMRAIASRLAEGLDVRLSHRVDTLTYTGTEYVLSGIVGDPNVSLRPRDPASYENLVSFGSFDVVLVCLPADQALTLLEPLHAAMAMTVSRARLDPCLALAFIPDEQTPLLVPFDGLFVGTEKDPDRTIAWMARDSSKTGRASQDTWVIHAAPGWSRLHLRDSKENVEQQLLTEVARLLGLRRLAARASLLHRWAYASVPSPLDVGAIFNDELNLGVGGDWSAGGRVEGAFLAGMALAERLFGAT